MRNYHLLNGFWLALSVLRGNVLQALHRLVSGNKLRLDHLLRCGHDVVTFHQSFRCLLSAQILQALFRLGELVHSGTLRVRFAQRLLDSGVTGRNGNVSEGDGEAGSGLGSE